MYKAHISLSAGLDFYSFLYIYGAIFADQWSALRILTVVCTKLKMPTSGDDMASPLQICVDKQNDKL
jgi:hypothetical protein